MIQDNHPSAMGELVARLDAAYVREGRLKVRVREMAAAASERARLIERQADHIALLEALLAANGARAQARLRKSPWWIWRGFRGLLAGLAF